MTETISFEFEVLADTMAVANLLTGSLQDELRYSSRDITVTRLKPSGTRTQDLGTILLVILSTRAMVEVSKGFGNWLAKHHPQATVIVRKKNGEVIEIKNVKPSDVPMILDRIFRCRD